MSRSRPARRVLMVCMGNICRSPTAEGVLRAKLAEAGLGDTVTVDSAGTHGYHVGSPPDARSQRHARERGYDLSSLRARRVDDADFERFDLILAMDEDNLEELLRNCPAPLRGRVRLLMAFAGPGAHPIVPDPYSGGPGEFEWVLDLVEEACDGVVAHLQEEVGHSPPPSDPNRI